MPATIALRFQDPTSSTALNLSEFMTLSCDLKHRSNTLQGGHCRMPNHLWKDHTAFRRWLHLHRRRFLLIRSRSDSCKQHLVHLRPRSLRQLLTPSIRRIRHRRLRFRLRIHRLKHGPLREPTPQPNDCQQRHNRKAIPPHRRAPMSLPRRRRWVNAG